MKQYAKILALLILPLIGAALWVCLIGIQERMRVSEGIDQVLTVISAAQKYASSGIVAIGPELDLIASLHKSARLGGTFRNITPESLLTPWNDALRLKSLNSQTAELIVQLPPQACREMLLFFYEQAANIQLQTLAVFNSSSQKWTLLHKSGTAPDMTLKEEKAAQFCAASPAPAILLHFPLQTPE